MRIGRAFMFSGENIRKLRIKKALTLQALSRLSGISKSMLSEIENNKKNPSIELVLRIADALGVNISNLVDLQEKPSEPAILIKASDQQTLSDPVTGTKLLFISPPFGNNSIEFTYNTTPPSNATQIFSPSPDTIKYFYVIQGILQIRLGENTYKLSKGDSLSFNANIEQQYASVGSEECQYYVIVHRLPL